MAKLTILCVHGVGQHPQGGDWESVWRDAINSSLAKIDPKISAAIQFVYYDDIFAKYNITFAGTMEAIGKLMWSGITSLTRRPRGISSSLRWTAGMVVQWVENEKLRAKTRQRIQTAIKKYNPDIICAHSLGTLVSYDTFIDDKTKMSIQDRIFISCGSQIGNPFVVGNFLAGRIVPLSKARYWYHLYNEEDDVFTAPINLSADNFKQINTLFDIAGIADHNVECYMQHENTIADVWSDIVLRNRKPKLFQVPKALPRARWAEKTDKRALLVGINAYPQEAMRLEGCVNDVFLMSSLLQESGFAPEDIRVVLDDRATAQGIRERFTWLLEGAGDGNIRVFYYSGHGAQMPSYGLGDKVDRMDEALVPYDFDWTPQHAITDDQFYKLYSQLPYGLNFLALFDCCHSGGMTKDGGRRIRGINPPDDIRHRMIRWDSGLQMWVERELTMKSRPYGMVPGGKKPETKHRLGYAEPLRLLSKKDYKNLTKERGHNGPYMPLLIYACQEDEFSYEYRHGTISHGAFTFCFAKNLRGSRQKGKPVTFTDLVNSVSKDLLQLQYDQHPQIAGPTDWKNAKVPLL